MNARLSGTHCLRTAPVQQVAGTLQPKPGINHVFIPKQWLSKATCCTHNSLKGPLPSFPEIVGLHHPFRSLKGILREILDGGQMFKHLLNASKNLTFSKCGMLYFLRKRPEKAAILTTRKRWNFYQAPLKNHCDFIGQSLVTFLRNCGIISGVSKGGLL